MYTALKHNPLTKFLIAAFATLLLLSSNSAFADCSPYIGQATLNEFFKDNANQSSSNNDFAEVKILNSALDVSIYSNWKIRICEQNDGGKQNSGDGCNTTALSSFGDTVKPWLILSGPAAGDYINTNVRSFAW